MFLTGQERLFKVRLGRLWQGLVRHGVMRLTPFLFLTGQERLFEVRYGTLRWGSFEVRSGRLRFVRVGYGPVR